MARFKKKKFTAEKPDPEENKNDLPEIEDDSSVSSNLKCEKCGEVAQHTFGGDWFCQKCGFEHKDRAVEKTQPEPTKETQPEPAADLTEDPIDKSATKKLTDRLFWLRIAVSIIGGVIATFAFEDIADVEEKRWTSIGFMIMLFIATAIISKYWKIKIANKKKYVTTGIGSFVFMYLFFWIFSHTVVHAGTSQSMIPGI